MCRPRTLKYDVPKEAPAEGISPYQSRLRKIFIVVSKVAEGISPIPEPFGGVLILAFKVVRTSDSFHPTNDVAYCCAVNIARERPWLAVATVASYKNTALSIRDRLFLASDLFSFSLLLPVVDN
jgi:hypothetical protein